MRRSIRRDVKTLFVSRIACGSSWNPSRNCPFMQWRSIQTSIPQSVSKFLRKITNALRLKSDDSDGSNRDDRSLKPLHLRRLFALAGHEKKLIGLALAAQSFSASATMVFPYALGQIVDSIQLQGGGENLDSLAISLAGVFTVAGVATITRVTALSLVGGRISRNMRKQLFESVMKQETSFFDQRQSGELVNRLSSDVAVVSRTLTDNTAKLLRNSITGATSLCMVLYLSPKLSAVALGFLPPMIVFGGIFGRTARRLSRELVDALASATQVASERIGCIRTVRLFGAEEFESRRYSDRVDDTYGLARRVALADGVFTGGLFYAAQMSLLGVLYVGGKIVMDPAAAFSVGSLTSFSMYAVNLGVAASSIGTAYGQLLRAAGSGQRVFEVIDRKPLSATSSLSVRQESIENDKSPGTARESLKAHKLHRLPNDYVAKIEFEDVHFSYRDHHSLLRGVNLIVNQGEICAVAGQSGSGKSSLMSLVSRLYNPSRGVIKLAGTDIAELDLTWLRNEISAVPQDPVLFEGTVASNIAYALPGTVDKTDLVEAAKAAASHEMIMKLPDGYDTRVGERGQSLSGGQRARVAIARALIRKPKVLVLDEATASLDNESELAVASAIKSAAVDRGITVLVIAHRMSSLRRADKIAVLSDGVIKESGAFDELIAVPGSYLARMINATDAGDLSPYSTVVYS